MSALGSIAGLSGRPFAPARCHRHTVRVSAVMQVSKTELRKPREENVEGAFYVDHTCIDCDTCRWMSPAFFKRANHQSAVLAQPQSEEEKHQAFQALLACPTFSIHARDKAGIREAEDSFPVPVRGTSSVYHCGFHDEKSFGCASYLVIRPEGNVMVDVPRFVPKLLKKIQAMGGVKYIFMTHRDDVAQHAKWAEALKAERIMHVKETNEQQGTDQVEVKLDGEGPWPLPDGSSDFEIVLTPGHTEAHCCAVYKPEKVLFAGDHLAADTVGEWSAAESPDGGFLGITRNFNWWRVDEQVRSCEKLAKYDWLHVLPGHGRPGSVTDAAQRERQIQLLVEREAERGLQTLELDHSGRRP